MGFSVSGSAVILFAGLLIAFGTWSTATANTIEQVHESKADRFDRLLHTQNTDIEITGTDWDGFSLYVDVKNTGATQLRVSAFDVLVDGEYRSAWARTDDSDILRAGETGELGMDLPNDPTRVKVVVGSGISDSAVVS